MKHLKLFEEFNEDEFEVSENPDFIDDKVYTISLSDVRGGGKTLSINQSQFNQSGSLRWKDFDRFEKADDEVSPFMKEPGEEFNLSLLGKGDIVSYNGISYKVI